MRGFFDAHCHLCGDACGDSRPSASESIVRGRMLCCVEPAEWPRLACVFRGWKGAVAAYGVHPWHALRPGDDWTGELERRLRADPDAWVGEIGLDGMRLASAPAVVQNRVFSEQLRLARRLDRRVNLHCVRAWDDLMKRLDADYLAGGTGREFIVHSFSGPCQRIGELARRGAYFGVGLRVAGRDSRRDRECAALLPEDRLVLESDAFLVPGVDEPGVLGRALAWLAGAREMPVAALADRLLENSLRLVDNG